YRIAFLQFMVDGDLGNVQIDDRCDEVEQQDDGNCQLRRGVDACIDAWQVDAGEDVTGEARAHHDATEDGAKNDCSNGQTFHPSVGEHQFLVRQVFGQGPATAAPTHTRPHAHLST